jgi:hypothetical protein
MQANLNTHVNNNKKNLFQKKKKMGGESLDIAYNKKESVFWCA